MYCLPDYIYLELLGALEEENHDLATAFDGYFDDTPQNGMYVCTDYDAYMDWLRGLMPDGDYGLFTAWDQNMLGQSGQGSGTGSNILPLP